MPGPDEALQALRAIVAEFEEFCRQNGAASEADTRAKLVTRILVDVCQWPETAIVRETHVAPGYIDYVLTLHGRRLICVEAKREGIAFVLPTGSTHKSLKLSGPLLSEKSVRDAVLQVRGYCSEAGIRYAVASNGVTWIVFRAVREDMPWREGQARIFPSLDYIIDHFTEFWNLMSYQAVASGALDAEFGSPHRPPRGLHRVIDRLFNADLPLQRNSLHGQLDPLIRTFFEDIADQDQLEIL